MKTLTSHYNELRDLIGDYVRLPAAAAEKAGIKQDPESSFGCNARLKAMREFLQPKDCDLAIDLGGNCAFFCLSLLHDKVIKRAKVVDQSSDLIEFGRHAADEMGLSQAISFDALAIDLPWLEKMPTCDVVICQNLIHHAGWWFDVDAVTKDGWGAYARKFMGVLREKAKYGVICVNMEPGRPVNWIGVKDEREEKAARFAEILKDAGWSICRQTEVFELVKSCAAQSPTGVVAEVHGPSKWLFNRGVRAAASKASITLSKFLGRGGLGRFVRGLPLAKAYKSALEETRAIRSDHYYLYLLE